MQDNDDARSEREALVNSNSVTVPTGGRVVLVVPPHHRPTPRRGVVFCVVAVVAIAWIATLTGTQQFVVIPVLSSSAKGSDENATTAPYYHQDRSNQRLGVTDAYTELNQGPTTQKRIDDMRWLDQVRFGACGRFPDFLSGSDTTTTRWIQNPLGDGKYKQCRNGEGLRTGKGCEAKRVQRYLCTAAHPTMPGVTVTIERFGAFAGTGGYDWTSTKAMDDVGALKATTTRGRNVAFVGGMAAPVDVNGTIIGYPPLHIHHAHIFPYGDPEERSQKINGSIGDNHDILFQSHGDTECRAEEGGVACLLNVLDQGMARVVEASESGLSADFEINDVRPEGSDELRYWFEIVLLHTEYKENALHRSTFVGINNPCVGMGPCTYVIPFDPNSNLIAYNYTHGDFGSNLRSGFMSNFILHTHQTIMDSAFLFLAPDNSVLEAVDSLRQGRDYPLILDCLDDDDEGYDIETAKRELFHKIESSGAQLVCEATRPSLLLETDAAGNTHAYDKRAQLNCLQGRVPLKAGDVLTVLAFNEIRPHDVTRSSKEFREQSPFENAFVVHQHSIFRFDLSYGDDEPDYVPPSYFYYSDHGVMDPNINKPLDVMIHTGCPETIRFGF